MADSKTETEQEPSIEEILQSIREIISEEDENAADQDKKSDLDLGAQQNQDQSSDLDLSPQGDESYASDLVLSQKDQDTNVSNLADAEKGPSMNAHIEQDMDSDDDEVLDLTNPIEDDAQTNQPVAKNDDIDSVLDSQPVDDIGLEDLPDQDSKQDNTVDADKDARIQATPPKTSAPVPQEDESLKPSQKHSSASEDAARNLLSEHTRSAALASLVKLSGQMPVERKDHPSGITLEDITRELMQPLLRQWLDDNLPDLIERLVQKEIRKMTQNMD